MIHSSIHFWDMDRTLVDTDCDISWKLFLIHKGLAPITDLEVMEGYRKQYEEGRLEPEILNSFLLREFAGKTRAEMEFLAQEHFEAFVRPMVYSQAFEMIKSIRNQGEKLCMITATNGEIAGPVARFLGFEKFLSTSLEIIDGRYTGNISGIYCYGAGKIPYIERFCRENSTSIAEAYYYGDSIADIPVLEAVRHPVAVNPVPGLRQMAKERGWNIIDFSKK
ncbi:MAG: HAD family hydrolase [Bacillota bacterium]